MRMERVASVEDQTKFKLKSFVSTFINARKRIYLDVALINTYIEFINNINMEQFHVKRYTIWTH